MHINYVDKKSQIAAYSHLSAPNLSNAFKNFKLVLAFDQSSTCTGLTVGDIKGRELLFMSFERDKKIEDYMLYKNTFKEAFNRIFKGCSIDTVLHEDTHSEGFVNTDKVLNTIRTMFNEIKNEYRYAYDIISVPQQTWKSCFLLKGYKQPTKENVAYAANIRIPTLRAVQDIYDSIGIFYFYKTEIMPSKIGSIYKPHKGTKIERRHNLSIRVIQCNSKEDIIYTDKEKSRLSKYGVKEFLYNNNIWIEENARMLTSHSNKVWIAEIDNTNKGKFVNAVWCNYDIIPENNMKLYCIVYRENKLNNAPLDK